MINIFLLTYLGAPCLADLRMASQTKDHGKKKAWEVQQRNRDVPFVTKYALYHEPSDFNYDGLKKQRDGGGYDNFLRSNIDNEQDRRNFKTEDGKDHLPFRSYETAALDTSDTVLHKLKAAPADQMGKTAPGDHIVVEEGVPFDIPLRWNNPHASEIEANIWLFNQLVDGVPTVVPIMKPCCSGEGYQDNAFTFTVPIGFTDKASCAKPGECILNIYAHSVETRMYSMGVPIVVKGSTGNSVEPADIKEAKQDVGFDLHRLRRLCLPSGSKTQTDANIETVTVYKARLSSDVYNHAYQNSDFSPYAGQQPWDISQNLQAAAILKMTVGNFGELGKAYAPGIARKHAKKLDKKARGLIRIYETTTNAIIEGLAEGQNENDNINQVTLESVAMPNHKACLEWRDQYNKNKDGRLRGGDRTGGYCPNDYMCLCKGDCYLGHGDKERDAYCAKMVPTEDGKGLKEVENTAIDRVGQAPQRTELCFRCPEVGSTKKKRQNTNTYIPSFKIQGEANVKKALRYTPPAQLESGFLTHPDTGEISVPGDTKAIVQIYMAVLTDMWPEFREASSGDYLEKYHKNQWEKVKDNLKEMDKYKLHYRGPVLKDTTATMPDATNFKKINAEGKTDNGQYAASQAWDKQKVGMNVKTVPNRAGPLGGNIMKSYNMGGDKYEKIVSPAGTLTPQYPVPENQNIAACMSAMRAGMQLEITEESEDMDALNRDADCDDDAVVQKQMDAYYKLCDAKFEEDSSFTCEPFEATCVIPGQNSQLPTQLFLAEGAVPLPSGDAADDASAAATISSFAGMALSLLAFL